MDKNFNRIIQYITNPEILEKLNSNTNIINELYLDSQSDVYTARMINASFLILLAGFKNEHSKKAQEIFNRYKNQSQWESIIRFYEIGIKEIEKEISAQASDNSELYLDLLDVSNDISESNSIQNSDELLNTIGDLFFPEGAGLHQIENRKDAVEELRNKRTVKITDLNPRPITDPTRQILFTSNILATIPLEDWDMNDLDFSAKIRKSLNDNKNEKQKYWYDHPIPLGIAPDKNEAIYGLRGLDEMVEFEKSTGRIPIECK